MGPVHLLARRAQLTPQLTDRLRGLVVLGRGRRPLLYRLDRDLLHLLQLRRARRDGVARRLVGLDTIEERLRVGARLELGLREGDGREGVRTAEKA